MRRTFQLALPNGLFGDPLVVVRPRLSPRVLLLDAGDTTALGPRTLLAVSDILVSHSHVDHVFGLARVLRSRLGRIDRPLRLLGPPGLAAQVHSHLRGYTWNLVDAFPLDLTVIEIHRERAETWRFPEAKGFEPALTGDASADAPALLDDLLEIRSLTLDHGGIPCLAWRVTEHKAYNVDPDRLAARGLPTGPWLSVLKEALRRGAPPETPIPLPSGGAGSLVELARDFILEGPGDSLVYASDIGPTPDAMAALADFARGARRLIIEAHFLEADLALAQQHGHLTAARAGEVARRAGVVAASPIHFSPRYQDRPGELLHELADAAAPVGIEPLAAAPTTDDGQ